MARPRVEVTMSQHAGSTRVEVEGEIDLSTAPQFQRELLASAQGATTLLVDLRGVTFIDSTGVGVLFRTAKKLTGDGGAMQVVCPAGPVRRVLGVSGFENLVPVHDSLEAAGGA